jgi:hypothetical protein
MKDVVVKIKAKGAIDPFDQTHFNKPLYCVYGYDCFPNVLTCMIRPALSAMESPTIWGYSVYKRQPGFRTLGQNLKNWYLSNTHPKSSAVFFDDQDNMLAYLKTITTPKVSQ